MEALFIISGGGLACSRRARHGALAGRRIAGASFVTLTCRRRGKLISGAGNILPGCWRRRGAGGAGAALSNSSPLPTRLLQGWRASCSAGPNEAQMHLPPSPRCRHGSIPAF